jgi:hypothetical protein
MDSLALKLEGFLHSLPESEVRSRPALRREVHSLLKKLELIKSLNMKQMRKL